jgi:hypothetical protein
MERGQNNMTTGLTIFTRDEFAIESAVLVAQASAVAYWPESQRVAKWATDQGFSRSVCFENGNVQGFWCAGGDVALLVFRGTSNPGQWLRDARFYPARHDWGHVHIGFRNGIVAVESDLAEFDPFAAGASHVWIGGHSLGGALALLAAARLKLRTGKAATLHTFGQPAVGLSDFAERFAIELPHRLWRVVNQDDIVARVPPWPLYRHTGVAKRIVRPIAGVEGDAAKVALEAASRSAGLGLETVRASLLSASLETAEAVEKAGLQEPTVIDLDPPQLSEVEFTQLQMALGGADALPGETTRLEGRIPFIANHAIGEYIRLLTQLRDTQSAAPRSPRLEATLAAPLVSTITRVAPETSLFAARVGQLRTAIVARQRVAEGAPVESVTESRAGDTDTFDQRQADETLSRIIAKAEEASERSTDRAAFQRALDILRANASPALRKLASGPQVSPGSLSADEAASLEAIVVADGTRPSFLLDGGAAPLRHPFMGVWEADVAATEHEMQRRARAIGRIQPKFGGNGNFFGTGSLVDRDKGIVLTNFHVLDDAMKIVPATDTGGAVRFDRGLEIDFLGEAYTFDTNIFRVVEATRHPTSDRGFGHLDAVTMRIEPASAASRLPEAPIALSRAVADYQQASGTSLCTIGFPGPPEIVTGTDVDWDFVIRTLFGNQFGVKRLAPGRVIRQPGTVAEDTLKIVFGHDATTFGGASGSPVFAWGARNQPAVGLHFAGGTEVSNYAIAVARVVDALLSLGVPM